jgi:hypothetical protein
MTISARRPGLLVCERCRATEPACSARLLYAGRPCCQTCDHDTTSPKKGTPNMPSPLTTTRPEARSLKVRTCRGECVCAWSRYAFHGSCGASFSGGV